MISAKTVQELRERTGCGMMDCKKALTEANGDMERAAMILREKGLAAAAKKAGRVAAEGLVEVYIENGTGAIVEVNSETDFVANNEQFKTFVKNIAQQIVKNKPASLEALFEEKYIADPSQTVRDALNEKIAKIGENMRIRRFELLEGVLEGYVHGGGRIGVLVQFKLGNEALASSPAFGEYAKNIAMQVAAAMPQYVRKEDVPSERVEKEKEILTAQALNEGKSQNIVERIVQGRICKFYEEVCLLEQAYIKDPEMSVKKYTENAAGEIGTDIEIAKFVRFEKGEGIAKKEDNFAEEVAKMIK